MKKLICLLLVCVILLPACTTATPTATPTLTPIATPEYTPTATPEYTPTVPPTDEPTTAPTDEPTAAPTDEPTAAPTDEPTAAPTDEPTAAPTDESTPAPTATKAPTATPTKTPTKAPTATPTKTPTKTPAATPTKAPEPMPTINPVIDFDGKTASDVVFSSKNNFAVHSVENNMLKINITQDVSAMTYFQYGPRSNSFFSTGKDGFASYVKNTGSDVVLYLRFDVTIDGERQNLFLNVATDLTYTLYPSNGSAPIKNNGGTGWNGKFTIPAGFEGTLVADFFGGFVVEGEGTHLEADEVDLGGLSSIVFFITSAKANTTLYLDNVGNVNFGAPIATPTPTPVPTARPSAPTGPAPEYPNGALFDGESLKILAITSSFGLNVTEHLYTIAKAHGVENVTVARLYKSACTLSTHISNINNNTAAYTYYKNNSGTWKVTEGVNMLHGILDEDWDIIYIQQSAAGAAISSEYGRNGSYVDTIVDYVNANKLSSKTRIIWNMNWAYQADSTNGTLVNTFNGDQLAMYNKIAELTQQFIVPRASISGIITSGTALQNVRTSYIGDTLTKDGQHLNDLGRYIAGYTLYALLTGQDLTELKVSSVKSSDHTTTTTISDADKLVILEAINNARKNPYTVTQSSYKTK